MLNRCRLSDQFLALLYTFYFKFCFPPRCGSGHDPRPRSLHRDGVRHRVHVRQVPAPARLRAHTHRAPRPPRSARGGRIREVKGHAVAIETNALWVVMEIRSSPWIITRGKCLYEAESIFVDVNSSLYKNMRRNWSLPWKYHHHGNKVITMEIR